MTPSDHETPAVICGFFYSSAKKLRQWFLHLNMRPMTPCASLNVQASKKSYSSKVTRTLQTKRKPDARIVCTHNNLVQKGSMGKHNHTELINTARQVLKYSQFPNREGAQYLAETVINTS